MTEQNPGNSTETTQPVSTQQPEQNVTQTSESVSAVPEKMISQSEVGKIAGASRKEGHDKGYERGYQEALSKYQQQQIQSATPHAQASEPTSSTNIAELVAKQVSETLKREREEQAKILEKQQVEEYVTRLGSELKPKLESAKEKYEDFDAAVANLHLDKTNNPLQLMQWINSVPNAGDVLYDLAKNPQKMAILNSMHAPELALQQINILSQSLQNNQAAQDHKIAKDPLSVLTPSNVGKSTAPSSQQTIEDARKRYRF